MMYFDDEAVPATPATEGESTPDSNEPEAA